MKKSEFFMYWRTRLKEIAKAVLGIWLIAVITYLICMPSNTVNYLSQKGELPNWVMYYLWFLFGSFTLGYIISTIFKIKCNPKLLYLLICIYIGLNIGILFYYKQISIISSFLYLLKEATLFALVFFIILVIPFEIIGWKKHNKDK